jgi:hypothetical protein
VVRCGWSAGAVGGEFRHWHCDLFGDEGQHFGPRRLVDVQETARKTNSREPAWMARMTVARATVDHKIQDIELSPDHAALLRFERSKAQ